MNIIKKARLSDSLIAAIKEMIALDGFNSGDKFYSENELTKKLQVSRSSVRESLRILEVTGQVVVKQGKGIFIAEAGGQQLKGFTVWLKNNEQSIKDIFEVRLIIEPKAAGHAAEKAIAADIQILDEVCCQFGQFAQEGNAEGAIQCDRRFHRILAGATQNETLHVLMKSMTTALPEGWITSLCTPGRIEKTIHEHIAVLDAIKRQNKIDAENAMTRHLVNALHDISTQLKKQS